MDFSTIPDTLNARDKSRSAFQFIGTQGKFQNMMTRASKRPNSRQVMSHEFKRLLCTEKYQ